MRRYGTLARVGIALAFLAVAGFARASEEVSLLTSDGTLHVVTTGRAVDLGVQDPTIQPDRNVIEWTSRAQDGTLSMAVLPNSVSSNEKRGLQLAFDDQTQNLLLLWTEDTVFGQVHVGVLHNGTWTNSGLLPTQGISLSYNPKMTITHQPVTYLDEHDNPVSKTSSMLAIVWWEDALIGQARLANLFLDEENFDTAELAVYDLPALTGGGGDVSYDGVPTGAYVFPSIQPDGLTGAVLVSYADLHDQKQRVLRVEFPRDYGKPSDPNSVNWKRRHAPIVGIAMEGPIARVAPNVADTADGVRTTIGAGYRPTLSWSDGTSLRFTRLDGADWAPVRSIAIDDQMTYEKALSLVTGMGGRN
jgi:hypothetical protein